MKTRKQFIDYVKNGSSEPLVSLQIGAGAGFDCKLAGKEWISEGTIEDTVRAYEIVECAPFINLGLPECEMVSSLVWQTKTENTSHLRKTLKWLDTPHGQIRWELHEKLRNGTTPMIYPLTAESSNWFEVVSWYADEFSKVIPYIADLIGPLLQRAQPYGPVCIQWNVQPFELLGLMSVDNLVLTLMSDPGRYRKVCDKVRQVNIEIIKSVFKAGTDFIFLGGPGSEMLSPSIYEDFLIPDSEAISKAVHDCGGLIYSHICSPIEPCLSKGYYNRMGLDLFETLSPPPVGNVADLKKAREVLDGKICTRGNVGLDVLLTGSTEDVERETLAVLEATRGSKHIIAASDYLFYDIPLENVKAMIQAAKGWA